jgi:glycogen phosphorylase
MVRLTARFSSNRMMREYVEQVYLPAHAAFGRRGVDGGKLGQQLHDWEKKVAENWQGLRFGEVRVHRTGQTWQFEAQVYFGQLDPSFARVVLYADPLKDGQPTRIIMDRKGDLSGAFNGFLFRAEAPATRPAEHYTARIVPFHPEALIPIEDGHILWRR